MFNSTLDKKCFEQIQNYNIHINTNKEIFNIVKRIFETLHALIALKTLLVSFQRIYTFIFRNLEQAIL